MPVTRDKDGLTRKQAKFVREYLVDLNATQAAIRSGYSKRAAGVQGSVLLKNPNVASVIDRKREKSIESTELTRERILLEYKRIALLDPADLHDSGGDLLAVHQMPEDARRAVSSLEHVKTAKGRTKLTKVKLADKGRALDSLTKLLGFEPPQQHNVTVSYGDILDKVWSDKGRQTQGSTKQG